MLTLKNIKDTYPDEFENLVEIGCSHQEIIGLYRSPGNKFLHLADAQVLDLINTCEDSDLFEELSAIYDKDETCFWDILNDENELVVNHGIDEVYETYTALVNEYGHEDSDYEEVDVMGMVNRRLNEIESDSENSDYDNGGYVTEEYSEESYDDSYTATSSSEF